MKYLKYILSFIFIFGLFIPVLSRAQEIIPDHTEVIKAKVLEVKENPAATVAGTNLPIVNQDVTVLVLEGTKTNETILFHNDYIELKKGEVFYLNYTKEAGDNLEFYSVQDVDRIPVIYFFTIVFVILVLLVGGIQGLRGLLSLAGSFFLIIYVLLPGIMHGFSPVLVSIGVSSSIIILGSYITHGFNKTTSSAVLGMIITVIFTGIMAYLAVHLSQFSGYATEESMYLNLNSKGTIDVVGILIGGMMIGFLGVLYDVSIGQAISVEELHHIAPHLPKTMIWKRAMRIGREHIGALVNTLAIAYVGASLPLLLLFSIPPVNAALIVNREVFATEIIRALIGSIGLILAVPITTLFAVLMLIKTKQSEDVSVLEKESQVLKKIGHHH